MRWNVPGDRAPGGNHTGSTISSVREPRLCRREPDHQARSIASNCLGFLNYWACGGMCRRADNDLGPSATDLVDIGPGGHANPPPDRVGARTNRDRMKYS